MQLVRSTKKTLPPATTTPLPTATGAGGGGGRRWGTGQLDMVHGFEPRHYSSPPKRPFSTGGVAYHHSPPHSPPPPRSPSPPPAITAPVTPTLEKTMAAGFRVLSRPTSPEHSTISIEGSMATSHRSASAVMPSMAVMSSQHLHRVAKEMGLLPPPSLSLLPLPLLQSLPSPPSLTIP